MWPLALLLLPLAVAQNDRKLELLQQNKSLILTLAAYAEQLQHRIDKLRSLSADMRRPLKAAKGMEEQYLSNPLHSFPLLRQMHTGWQQLEQLMAQTLGQDQIDELKEMRASLPRKEHLDAAVLGLLRIQRMYGLEPAHMAQGLVYGVQHKSRLNALDCYTMGVEQLAMKEFLGASKWLLVTLDLLEPEEQRLLQVLGIARTDVLQLCARALRALDLKQPAMHVLKGETNRAAQLLQQYTERIEGVEPHPKGPESDNEWSNYVQVNT